MKKVTITAGAISGNRGAEAMTVTTIREIRRMHPDAIFGIMTPYPSKDRSLVTDSKCVILSSKPSFLVLILFPLSVLAFFVTKFGKKKIPGFFPKEVRFIAQSDVVVDVAGVSFIDGREKFLPYNILTLFTAFLFDVPVVKLAQAMGPFTKPINRFCSKLFLLACYRIFARGKQTKRHFDSMNLPVNVLDEAPDIVFLNQPGDSISSENDDRVNDVCHRLKTTTRTIVGVCPSAVIYKGAIREGWDYIGFNVDIIRSLIDAGYHVLLFPNATRQSHPDKLMNNDLPVITQIHTRLITSPSNICEDLTIVDFDVNSDGIKELVSTTAYCLVSRFHAMIFCLLLEKPLVVIGWSHKYKEVLDEFGLGEYVFDFKNLDCKVIIETLKQVDLNRSEITDRIKEVLISTKQLASHQFDFVNNLLND